MTFKTFRLYKGIKTPVFISLLCFVFCVVITETVIDQYQKNEQQKQLVHTQEISDNIQTTLLASINESFRLNGLRAYFIATQGRVRPEELNTILANYFPKIGPDQLIRYIDVAPDNQIQYIFPLKGNEKALGLHLTELPKEWPIIKRAIQEKQPVLIGPVDLVQGVSGLIYSIPVFITKNNYWGMISIVVNTDQLFNVINKKTTQQHLEVALRGRNGDSETGEVFLGNANLFDGEGLRSTLNIPGGAWQLIVKPAAINKMPLMIAHITGLLLACLMASLLFTALTASRERRKTADLLSLITSQIPGMVFKFQLRPDGSSCFPLVSDGIRDLYRLNPKDVRDDASKLFALFHPDDLADINAAIQKSMQDLCNVSIEFRVQHLDGTVRWLLAKSVPQPEKDGSMFWYGFTTDITDHKLLEDKMLANKHLLKSIIDSIPASIYAFDLQNRVIVTNQMGADFYGKRPEEIFGKTVQEFFPKAIADNKMIYINQAKMTGKPVDFEEQLIHPASGGLHTFLASKFPIKSLEGRIYGVGGVAIDITERKQTENKLRLSDTALSIINQGIVITDTQQNILWVNKAFETLTGYSLSELTDLNCRLLQGALTNSETVSSIRLALERHQPFFGEILNYRKDGSSFWNDLAIFPVFNDSGHLINFMSSCRDLTEIKQAEITLQQGKAEADHASFIKSQFLAMMSHEIRTPLNAILGMHELLNQTFLDSVQTDYLKIATQAGSNLLAIVNDILDLTKVESGKLILEQITFDVVDLTHRCVELLTLAAQAKGLTLTTVIAPELNSWLSADPFRYRQVLTNLLSNAIKYTSTGTVTIKLSAEPNPEDNCVLLVEVIDTGIGIPLASQAGLFEVFVQVDPSDTRKYGGSGLGLAISKRLVALWKGHIGLESAPTIGSRFWFTVGSKARAPTQEIKSTLMPVDKNTLVPLVANLLLVDDSLINQAVVAAMLRNAGHRVDLADCGHAGIEAAKNKNYDLILMDVSMPDMSGMEATALIRQLGGVAASVPIIALTAHALAGYQELCLAAGMNGYATKPINQKDLLAIVTKWCAKTVTNEAPVSSALIEDSAAQLPNEPTKILDKAILEEMIALFGQEKINELLQMALCES